MTTDHSKDARVVMTLDAGGTSLRFSARRGAGAATPVHSTPTHADDLERCLQAITDGFTRVAQQCPTPPVALSFGFPGPADYRAGIIGDLPNLPAFRGGVALGPMLEDRFGLPVFIRNDGSLFAYGEAMSGFLPFVNGLLERAGSPKRYATLLGVTLGTGLGGGLVVGGEMHVGDNSGAGQIWLLRNKLERDVNAEEGACIRAVRRVYAERAGVPLERAPDPRTIYDIGTGARAGDQAAARESFRRLGEVTGDACAQALTLMDGLAVVGGGISASWPLFLPALVREMNGSYRGPAGASIRRLGPAVYDLEDAAQREAFVRGAPRSVRVPGGAREVPYDAMPRVGVGVSRLGTTEAIALGAYAVALRALDAAAAS